MYSQTNAALRHYYDARNQKLRVWTPKAQLRMFHYLTSRQYRDIMTLVQTETMKTVAEMYGVSYKTVCSIKYGTRSPRRVALGA